MPAWLSKKSKLIRALVITGALLFISAISFMTLQLFLFAHRPVASEAVIELATGSSLTTLSHQLVNAKVLAAKDRKRFVFLVNLSFNARNLKKGEYEITATTTPWQLIEKITAGDVMQHKITFPEGITFKDMITIISSNPTLKIAISNLNEHQIRHELGITSKSVEGVFYPDTYVFTKGTPDKVILQQALHRMREIVGQEWQQRSMPQTYQTPYDALIAASLVEKETADDNERFLVATVIINRLQANMPLQIDSAVIYGMAQAYKGYLLRSDLKFPSPYNTYLNRGLPPSPIALASQKSIHAALHPLKSKNLYYVSKADGTGTHLFANSLAEHVKNIQWVKQQKKLEGQYGTTL